MIEYKGYKIYDKLKIKRDNGNISLLDNNSSLRNASSWSILLEFYIYSNGDIIRSIYAGWGNGDFKIYYDNNILTIRENTSGDKYEINNIEMNKKIRLYYNYNYNLDSSTLKINNILYQHTLNNKINSSNFLLQKAIYKYIVFNDYYRNTETEFIPATDNDNHPGFLKNGSTYSVAVSSSSNAEVLDADDQEKLEEIIDGSVRVLYNEGVELLRHGILDKQYNLKFVNLPHCQEVRSKAFCNCRNLKFIDLSNCNNIYPNAFEDTYNSNIILGVTTETLRGFYWSFDDNVFLPNLITLNLNYSQTGFRQNIYLNNSSVVANLYCDSPQAFDIGRIETVYVPESLYNDYINNPSWANYTNKIMNIPNTII